MRDNTPFAEWLRQRRRTLDLTQAELAQQVNCSPVTIRKLEYADSFPSKELAAELARLLGVSNEEEAAFVRFARGEQGKNDKVTGWQEPVLKVTKDDKVMASPVTLSTPHSVPPLPTHNLPEPTTPLVGRQAELAQIQSMLADPACRVLTLTGPGGMGKTRLALAAARAIVDLRNTKYDSVSPVKADHSQFLDGLYFVPLAAISEAAYIVPAIADAIGLRFAGQLAIQTQLFNYLRPKELLLVLDNLEQLLSPNNACSEMLFELLRTARGLKLLVTSREPLNLPGEWLVELAGLTTPTLKEVVSNSDASRPGSKMSTPLGSDAMALFLQCARRLQANFTPNGQELAAVIRTCHLVDGLPLGIELAASWVRALSCTEIADEIEKNLMFLATNQRCVPARHRSMQAVFDHSWQLLAEEEQRVLAGLSVFRGGFTRAAAVAVTGATLADLSTLIAKSLVRRSGEQRYELHELVRQFAATKAQTMAGELANCQRRHADYFGNWVASCGEALMSSRQTTVVNEFLTEIGNIRLALDEMIAQQRAAPLRAIGWVLWHFFELVYYFQEGEATFQRAQAMLQALCTPDAALLSSAQAAMNEVTLIKMTALRAYFSCRRGNLHAALPHLATAVTQLQQHNEPQLLAFLSLMYGMSCWAIGKFEEAIANQRQAIALSCTHGPHWVYPASTMFLGAALHEVGNFEEAYQTLSTGLQAAHRLGDPRGITFCISILSRTAQTLGRSDEVIELLQTGRALAEQSGDRFSIAFTVEYLALALFARGEASQAQQLLVESRDSYRQLGDRWNLARVLNYLGGIALQQHQFDEARSHFAQAVQAAHAADVLPQVLAALLGLAMIRAQRNDLSVALATATIIEQHNAATQEVRVQAEALCRTLSAQLPTTQVEVARNRFQNQTLDTIISEALALWSQVETMK